MKKILVADTNISVSKKLKEYFSDKDYTITATTTSGYDVIKNIEKETPDLVVCEFSLPLADGINVLSYFYKKKNAPIFIMFSAIKSEQAIQKALSLGAVYHILKPCSIEDLGERIEMFLTGDLELIKENRKQNKPLRITKEAELLFSSEITEDLLEKARKTMNTQNRNTPLRVRTTTKLMNLGMKTSLKGFKLILDAVEIVYKDKRAILSVMDKIYAPVAKEHDMSVTAVERPMRYAISTCWKEITPQILKSELNLNEKGKAPSCAHFITLIVTALQLEDML